ncbi:MAG: HU family DNA-binding protein [Bacteroidota bacterium]|jgi:DNA-binding protein HU-beta
MTKADIVSEISDKTGIEKIIVQTTIEAFMKSIRSSMSDGKNVYLRGFGTFLVKKRAEKIGRNISKNTTVVIPAHYIPAFKPAKVFSERVKRTVTNVEKIDKKQIE